MEASRSLVHAGGVCPSVAETRLGGRLPPPPLLLVGVMVVSVVVVGAPLTGGLLNTLVGSEKAGQRVPCLESTLTGLKPLTVPGGLRNAVTTTDDPALVLLML